MRRYLKVTAAQLFCIVLIFLCCFLYLKTAPAANSWLHVEPIQEGQYKIGKIDLLLNSLEDVNLPISLNLNAPTRFFDPDRDENFNMAVNRYQLTCLNRGDIDVKVDFSYTDNNNGNYTVFYIFIPADTQDSNFLSGDYKTYLDSVFAGYPVSTNAERKAAMNSVNAQTLNAYQAFVLQKDEQKPVFDLLIWAEYDNMGNTAGSQYLYLEYPITIKAYSYQFYE